MTQQTEQQTALEKILETLSGDESLREALRTHLLPSPNQNTGESGRHVRTSLPPGTGVQQTNPALATRMYQSGDNPVLAAQTHQSGNTNSQQRAGVNDNPLVSHIRQLGNSNHTLQETHGDDTIGSGEHQLEAGQQLGASDNAHVQQQQGNSAPHNFDPDMFDSEDDNTFVAQGVVTEYLEKHFRRTLNKASRTAMHKTHPVPRTTVMKPAVVDQFVKDYLKSRFPKQEDGELMKVQSAMLKVCGPMTCMWSDLIEQDLLDDPDATISVHDVLEIIQRSLVLLGNANELLSQMRRKNLLQLADKSLAKYGQDSPSQAGEFLFGPEFTKHLQDKVESDSSLAKVVSATQRYHPYNNTLRTTTISRSKQQFFRGGPAGKWGSRQGKPRTSTHQNHYRGRGSARTGKSAPSKKY